MKKASAMLRPWQVLSSLWAVSRNPPLPLFSRSCIMRRDTTTSLAASRRMIHLNHAGASPSSDAVLERMVHHLHQEQVLGGYAAKDAVQDELAAVYKQAATLIHANSPDEIALVDSATTAWTRLFYAFCQHQQQHKSNGQENIILVSQAEYAANVVAACQWAKTHPGWSVWAIPSQRNASGKTTGKVDLEQFASMLNGTYRVNGRVLDPRNIAVVCVTHIPTNAGIVNPVEQIGAYIHEFNNKHQATTSPCILFLADTCQSVGHVPVNVQDMQCHGLTATGRKCLRGPRGTGFLWISNDLLSDDPSIMPHHVDHYGVPVLSIPSDMDRPLQDVMKYAPRRGAQRFEFWESNIAGRLGLGQALAEALALGQANITSTILERTAYLVHQLRRLERVHLHYEPECGIIAFWVDGIDSSVLAQALQSPPDQDIVFEVSVVPATSTPLDTAVTGVPDLLRASVSYTTTQEELDLFVERLCCLIE